MVATLVTGLLGCAGGPPSGDAPPDDTDTDLPTDTDDPVPVGTDEASIVVMASLPTLGKPDPEILFTAMFVQSRLGFRNLAQCVGAPDSFCVRDWPAVVDDYVLVEDYDPSILAGLDTRYVGDDVTLGPWAGPYVDNPGSGLGYYYQPFAGATLPDYPYTLQFDGGSDWPSYSGSSVLSAPTHLEVTNFDPLQSAILYDSAPIPLRWAADPGSGDVHLVVRTPLEDRLYLLEDDGEHDLDLSGLGLQDEDEVEIVLGRWTRTTIDHGGNDIELVIQSNQRIRGTWSAIGPRVELTDLYDTCAEAESAAPTPPGNYYGSLAGFTNDLNPTQQGCTGFMATGADAVLPIELQPDDLLEVTYGLQGAGDASVYLLADCADESTCVVGADNTLVAGTEILSWLNTTPLPVRAYLVLDAYSPPTNDFDLTITVTSLGGDVLVPTCIEAIEQGPVASGDYHGFVGGNADYLDPTCAAGAAGGEGMVQVYLEAGQTLTADVRAPGGSDVKLYLLSNCAIADSCFYAENAEAGQHEQLVYQNTGPSSAWFYLVLDGDTNPDEYLLDVVVQ